MIDIIQGDCLKLIKDIDNDSIDLIVTSPPYNKGYWSTNQNIDNYSFYKTKSRRIEYGDFKDDLDPKEYEKQQRELLSECIRVLKPSGSIFYNHQDILYNHQTIHPTYVYDYPLKQIIIWDRKSSPKLDKSYYIPITEYIFWIKKSKDQKCKFYRNKAIFNKCIWEMSPDKSNSFPAPFPIELPYNCIVSCTDENDVVLDPYSGSGTTALACKMLNRNFIGFELNPEYIEMSNNRLSGNLNKVVTNTKSLF